MTPAQPSRSWSLGRAIVPNPLARPITNNRWSLGRLAAMSARSPFFPFTWAAFRAPSALTINALSAPTGWAKGIPPTTLSETDV